MQILVFILLFFCTLELQANVRIEGYYKVDVQSPDEEFKSQAVKIALAKGIHEYVAVRQPEYLPYFTQFASLSILAEKVEGLVIEYAILEQVYEKGSLTTEVFGELNINSLKQRLSKFAVVNRVDANVRSEFVFVFLGRQACEGDRCPSGYQAVQNLAVASSFKETFQRANFLTKPAEQLEQVTGGMFNKNLLLRRYVNTGQVNWDHAVNAALTSATNSDRAYIVVGTYEVLSAEKNPFLDTLWDVSVLMDAQIVNASNGTSIFSSNVSISDSGETISKAMNMALRANSLDIAEKMVNFLQSNSKY